MALANYSDLKASVQDWIARSGLSSNAEDWIRLAEARLNRELNPVEVDQNLTGVLDSREINVSAYAIVEALDLYLIDTDTSDETLLTPKSDFARGATSDRPRYWDYLPHASAGKIIFDCPLDKAYTFRLRHRQRFALSDSADTNWLLTYHPDVYLAASIIWGLAYTGMGDPNAIPQAGAYKLVLEEALPEVRNIIARSKRAVAALDPALRQWPRYGTYDGTTDN